MDRVLSDAQIAQLRGYARRDFLAESQITQSRVAEQIKNLYGESAMPGDNLLGIFLDHVVTKRGNQWWRNLLDRTPKGSHSGGGSGIKNSPEGLRR